MSDNFLITQGSGTTIATHQNVDGSHEQKVQVTVAPSTLAQDSTLTAGNIKVQLIDNSAHALNIDPSGTARVNVVNGSVTISNFPADQLVTIDRSGRTPVLKTGTLVTTAITTDQVILTYTVTAGKTLWLQYIALDVRLTVISATASILGAISLESPSGTKVFTATEVNPTTSETAMSSLSFAEPIPISAGTVIRWVTTPAATTSMTWIANFGGYEQ